MQSHLDLWILNPPWSIGPHVGSNYINRRNGYSREPSPALVYVVYPQPSLPSTSLHIRTLPTIKTTLCNAQHSPAKTATFPLFDWSQPNTAPKSSILLWFSHHWEISHNFPPDISSMSLLSLHLPRNRSHWSASRFTPTRWSSPSPRSFAWRFGGFSSIFFPNLVSILRM